MKVFKFGGASIKDAEAVKNILPIIQKYKDHLIVVVSAMGKTTNALEEILNLKFQNKGYQEKINLLYSYHFQITSSLFKNKKHQVFKSLKLLLADLEVELSKTIKDYNEQYDQVVSHGELISSMIVSHYINESGIDCALTDARDFVKTNGNYREAKVDWLATEKLISEKIPSILRNGKMVLTQGFIGRNQSGKTTTLGREGSDFTAAIFAFGLNAESVMIWKDVPGILNADPKIIKQTVKFDELSYHEAAEMTYYGASVIHPKTIKPLANKKIPLWVKSFENHLEPGTCIHDCTVEKHIPSIIFKANQSLISFHVRDFTFIDESNLSLIYHTLAQLNIKINMMQNSAISFSICIDNQQYKIKQLLEKLKNDFNIYFNDNLQLITVKNYDLETIDFISKSRNILLEQKTRHNFQIVVGGGN